MSLPAHPFVCVVAGVVLMLASPALQSATSPRVAGKNLRRLFRGQYMGSLYDVGFDQPETHAVRKGTSLYYGFFAPEFKAQVQLRGLGSSRYRTTDYENGKDLGTVSGPVASLNIDFTAHLLLAARPE